MTSISRNSFFPQVYKETGRIVDYNVKFFKTTRPAFSNKIHLTDKYGLSELGQQFRNAY